MSRLPKIMGKSTSRIDLISSYTDCHCLLLTFSLMLVGTYASVHSKRVFKVDKFFMYCSCRMVVSEKFST